jgi:hypothetical protein
METGCTIKQLQKEYGLKPNMYPLNKVALVEWIKKLSFDEAISLLTRLDKIYEKRRKQNEKDSD